MLNVDTVSFSSTILAKYQSHCSILDWVSYLIETAQVFLKWSIERAKTKDKWTNFKGWKTKVFLCV